MKVCTKCKNEKPLSEFHRYANNPDGYHYNCKDCKAAYRKKNDKKPHVQRKQKEYYFQYKYGISIEEYEELLASQNGVCAICGRDEKDSNRSGNVLPLAVDHDHKTSEVRGLLCRACNLSLGFMEDNITFLDNAIRYLKRYGGDK